MERMEMIDKLCEKAGIGREEAADALNRANWDMLEALVILEKEGRIPPLTSSVVTRQPAEGDWTYAGGRGAEKNAWTANFGDKLKALMQKSVAYSFIVRRRGREIVSLPVLLAVIIVLATFQVSAVVLLLGLLFECAYSVEKRN